MALTRAERSLLLAALYPARLDLDLVRRRVDEGVDWDRLARSARSLGTGALLGNALERAGVDQQVPREVRAELRVQRLANEVRNRKMMEDAARAQAILQAVGVTSVLLKGGALLSFAPEHAGLRTLSDVDVLIPRSALERAVQALVAGGFRQVHAADPRFSHHPSIHKAPSGTALEIHTGLPEGPYAAGHVPDAVWSEAPAVETEHGTVRVLSLPHLLAVTAAHALEHHGADWRLLPRLVSDVDVLLALGADRRSGIGPSGALREALRLHADGRRRAMDPAGWPRSRLERALDPDKSPLVLRLLNARIFIRVLLHGGARFLAPPGAAIAARYGVPESSRWIWPLRLWRLVTAPLRVFAAGKRPPHG